MDKLAFYSVLDREDRALFSHDRGVDAETLVNRYKVQLDYYQEALEKMCRFYYATKK